jgi:hypothetical protein
MKKANTYLLVLNIENTSANAIKKETNLEFLRIVLNAPFQLYNFVLVVCCYFKADYNPEYIIV